MNEIVHLGIPHQSITTVIMA